MEGAMVAGMKLWDAFETLKEVNELLNDKALISAFNNTPINDDYAVLLLKLHSVILKLKNTLLTPID